MINIDRRKKILEILEKEGRIATTDLQAKLGVTGATVRSDLRARSQPKRATATFTSAQKTLRSVIRKAVPSRQLTRNPIT